jgi:galactosylxylosylprotein 3-beta-galactosyltransferase
MLCNLYIPYARGVGYLLSVNLVRFISAKANILRTYCAKDASVGTWLAPLKVQRVHYTRFNAEWLSRGCSNTDLVSHKQSVQKMRSKQYSLVAKGVLCEREKALHKTYTYNWKVPPSK